MKSVVVFNLRPPNKSYFGVLIVINIDCKTVRIFVFKYARAVKQKVWNEAENRERDRGETLKTLTPRFTNSVFTDFEKKTDCFAVYDK